MPLVTLRHFNATFASNAATETNPEPSKYPVVVIEAMSMVTSADTAFSVSGRGLVRLQDALDDEV